MSAWVLCWQVAQHVASFSLHGRKIIIFFHPWGEGRTEDCPFSFEKILQLLVHQFPSHLTPPYYLYDFLLNRDGQLSYHSYIPF